MKSAVEHCPRCKQPTPGGASVCPNCGDRLSRAHNFPIYIGIVGLLTLIFVVVVMLQVIRKSEFTAKPADTADDADQVITAPPDKQPPLNK